MAIAEFAFLSLVFGPVFSLLILVIVLASLGKSLGIRRRYVNLLLKVFEFGRTRIERYEKRNTDDDSSDDEPMENLADKTHITKIADESGDKTSLPKRDSTHALDRVIERDIEISTTGIKYMYDFDLNVDAMKREFQLADAMYFAKCGMEAIIEDSVTKCFSAAELASWNLLSRTNMGYQYVSLRLTILWGLGCIFRYFFLLPFRVALAVVGIGSLVICTAFIGYMPATKFKRSLVRYISLVCFRIMARACSAITVFHNRENLATDGICVANHTSPIDVIVMSCDNCYSMVGQTQGGFMGWMQRSMARATAHVWFERSEMKDRTAVVNRLKAHVDDPHKLPILIFPEGTCVNNTSVMMFKKGSFDVGGTIYPAAIKYDPRFGDAFWNSSKQTMMKHLLNIMSSWALVCDVWYLPPMTRCENEDAVDFANRVKSAIAWKGGLVDLEWDGQLKRMGVKDSWKEKPQMEYSKLIKVE